MLSQKQSVRFSERKEKNYSSPYPLIALSSLAILIRVNIISVKVWMIQKLFTGQPLRGIHGETSLKQKKAKFSETW